MYKYTDLMIFANEMVLEFMIIKIPDLFTFPQTYLYVCVCVCVLNSLLFL